MDKLVAHFSSGRKENFLLVLKTKALIITLLSLVVLDVLLFLLVVSTKKLETVSSISQGSVLLFIAVILFILKRYGVKAAGNVLTIGLTLIIAFTLINISKSAEKNIIGKFVQGFYIILAFLAMNVLFSNKRVLILNAVIALIATTRVYMYAINSGVGDMSLIRMGYVDHVFVVLIISVVSFYTIRFSELAIEKANTDADTMSNQNQQLGKLFRLVSQTVHKLKKQTGTINNSTNSLSKNSTENAASLEEISATLEELTATIAATADYTRETAISIERTAKFSKENQEAISETLHSIQEIKAKIGLIQEVANKTGILSINASIEAARAGEFGKGFAVVAGEIRKLSENSGKGAVDIENLILRTMNISDKALKNFFLISKDIDEINKAVQHISGTSKEQKLSIEQINSSVSQLNESTQDNAHQTTNLIESLTETNLHINTLEKTVKIRS